MNEPLITLQVRLVLAHMLTDPNAAYYSFDIAKRIDLRPSTVSLIVGRLVRAGWLIVETETGDPRVLGRALRRYVRLSARGIDVARAVEAQTRLRTAPWVPAVPGP